MPAGHILIKKLISSRKSGDDGVNMIRYNQHLQVWNRNFLHQKKTIRMLHLDPLQAAGPSVPEARPDETRSYWRHLQPWCVSPPWGSYPKCIEKNGQRLGDSGDFLMPMQKSEKKPWEVPPLNNWKLTATMVLGPCFVKWMQLLISHNQITLW